MPDDLALLTGPAAGELLAAVLAVTDEHLVGWRVRQVDHRPGCGTTAAYDVRAHGREGERACLLVAGTGAVPVDAPGLVRLAVGEREVAVWRFPHDPWLPALAAANEEPPLRALLDDCGVPAGPVEVRVRAYRPGRRAVVEVRTPEVRLFVKVVRPPSAADLSRRHGLLREAGLPVPRSLLARPDGLVVLEALSGLALRARLREAPPPDLDGRAVLELLDGLPPALRELPRRRSWSDDAGHYAAIVAAALPAQAERCRQLAAEVAAAACATPGDDPVHGDLHEGQLLLDGDRVTGLLDLDSTGPGRRADDLACLLAHLAVRARLDPAHAAGTTALLERWRSAFERTVDPADLRARTAGVVLSLATGPHRVQSAGWPAQTCARLELAERELERH